MSRSSSGSVPSMASVSARDQERVVDVARARPRGRAGPRGGPSRPARRASGPGRRPARLAGERALEPAAWRAWRRPSCRRRARPCRVRAEDQQQRRDQQQAHRVAALHHVGDDDDDERDDDADQGCRVHQDSDSLSSVERPARAVGRSLTVPRRGGGVGAAPDAEVDRRAHGEHLAAVAADGVDDLSSDSRDDVLLAVDEGDHGVGGGVDALDQVRVEANTEPESA